MNIVDQLERIVFRNEILEYNENGLVEIPKIFRLS